MVMTKDPNQRSRAMVDLIILATVFWAAFSLRFFGIKDVGPITMIAVLAATALLAITRGDRLVDLGLGSMGSPVQLRKDTLVAMAAIGITYVVGGALIFSLLGSPETHTAVETLSPKLSDLLFEIFIIIWPLIAFGEEVFFRGIVLHRLTTISGNTRLGLAIAVSVQGIWFGLAHVSQGASGMLLTGLMGVVLATLFLIRMKRRLLPLILAHGIVDTSIFVITFIQNTQNA